MANLTTTKEDPKKQLWDFIEEARAVMLGVPATGMHMQPMAPQAAREENAIWFYTRRSSDLVKAAGAGKAHLCLIGADHDYHACLSGRLSMMHSRQHIDRFWSPVIAAWFDGKDDPDLIMLVFLPDDAQIWASSDSSFRFGWEIAKANLSGGEPDLGVYTHITW